MIIVTKSARDTQKAGELLAKSLKGKSLICLEGELGSGKTTFIQGMARGLEIKERITSPTFVILKRFKVPKIRSAFDQRLRSASDQRIKCFSILYHIDCYRVKSPKEILDLGLKEILSQKDTLVVIEWADRIHKILPRNRLTIKFEFIDEKTRKITIK